MVDVNQEAVNRAIEARGISPDALTPSEYSEVAEEVANRELT